MIFIAYQTLDLMFELGESLWISVRDQEFTRHKEGRPIASLFFSILLMLEIVETVKVFSQDHSVKIRIILLVGLIAVTRKILVLDMSHSEPIAEFAVAGLVIALSLGYFLISRSIKSEEDQRSKKN